MTATPILDVRHLVKSFGPRPVVDDLSFSVASGEIVGLLGPNGAGKTTTIQMLLGIIAPTSGEIDVFGLPLPRHRETILSQVNFSSTYVGLPYSLTVRENLMVTGRLYGVRPLRRRVDDIINLLDLAELQHHLTKTLSSGQLTRLHLAKSLINRPRLLFLDEPTASLDPDAADRMRALLRQFHREWGLSILVTSHNMREVEILADRVIFLDQGRILAEGTPEAITRQYAAADLEDLFLKIARSRSEPLA